MPIGAPLRVLRVYHGGRDPAHRARERALTAAGAEVTLVVPAGWGEAGEEAALTPESFRIVELPLRRAGDVNRHRYRASLARLIEAAAPSVLDIHEEPFSAVAAQWQDAAPPSVPTVMYTAQNIDKRFPPPFCWHERRALCRIAGLYPCSRQAAAVARGKGFAGRIDVLPLGYDERMFTPGAQSLDDDEIVLALVGRLVPEKGVRDAVRVLAHLNERRPTRLLVTGEGPEEAAARQLAAALAVADRLELSPWQSSEALAATYRRCHLLLVPSRPTETWTEQFGRVIVEAQASGAVVAGYATGAIPEAVGDAGIVVPSGDVEALGERVAGIVSDPSEFSRRRAAGLALASARTWQRVAAGQLELYRAAASGELKRDHPRSPRSRRRLAAVEFGPTAATAAGSRPFALPVLRRGGPAADLLGLLIDLAAELRARSAARLGRPRPAPAGRHRKAAEPPDPG